MRRTVHGYTLAELLVALGILAIFMTLFLAVVSASFRTVQNVQTRSDAQQKARVALNYIRDRIAQASSFTPGVEIHGFYSNRSGITPSPLAPSSTNATPCDFNSPVNWVTNPPQTPVFDGKIDFYDIGKREQTPPFHIMEDPLCLADPVPPALVTLPGGGTMSINENPDQRYPGTLRAPGVTTLYRTELEDLDGNATFSPIEEHLRTLVFETRSPSAASWGPSTCLAGTTGNIGAKVDRQVVTLAHTWREKTFWQDDNRNGTAQSEELRTEDFVLYERKTRYFEDPTRNLDVNCDGSINDADEIARVSEVPLVSGIIDVFYQFLDSRGELLIPCTEIGIGGCDPPSALNELANDDFNGEFICYVRIQYFDPGTGQNEINSDNVGVYFAGAPGWGACPNIDRIRVTVVAGSDAAIRLLRKSMDANFVPFRVFTGLEPRDIGALDYLGLSPYSEFYQKGSLVILQEELSLNLLGG
jgi:prepilin-type N-terminal cleavage/methylation domain-containing protein